METPLTLLYTANIGGDLSLLPALHTFIRQIKAQPVDDENTVRICATENLPQQYVLVDLGAACATDVWHCEVTGGRSALMVMDAMGYQAVNTTGYLSDESRAKLEDNLMQLVAVDTAHSWENDILHITVGAAGPSQSRHPLHLDLAPASAIGFEQGILRLASVQRGQVGMVRLNTAEGNGHLTVSGRAVFTMPPQTHPDPTIAGTVDFVLSEAQFYQRRRPS